MEQCSCNIAFNFSLIDPYKSELMPKGGGRESNAYDKKLNFHVHKIIVSRYKSIGNECISVCFLLL